jgi:hypothetical protein
MANANKYKLFGTISAGKMVFLFVLCLIALA